MSRVLSRIVRICWIVAVVLTGFAGAGHHSQAVETRDPNIVPAQITLEALVADVLAKNLELKFYEAEISAATGERRTAAVWQNPELSTSVGQKKITVGDLSDEGVAWAVSVQQTIEWPGRIPLRKAIADRQMRLAELGLERFKASLASRTRILAYNLFAAQEKSAAAAEVADRFRKLREVLVQRDPAGLTPQLETRIIEASELTLQRNATDAVLEVQAALLALNQLRGQPWTGILTVLPVKLDFRPAPDQEALLTAAQANNFELQMRRSELEQQGFKVALARRDGYPSITVAPYYSEEQAGDREQQFGVGVSLALPIWNRNKGAVATAEARRVQAETSIEVTQRDLDRRVIESALTYRTKVAEMRRWRPESVEEFRAAAELADRHYRLGAVPVATYVELQKQYLAAVEALLDTRREALEAGQLIQLLTGVEINVGTSSETGHGPEPVKP